jgi:glycosyltransferase involved in cell wall biosynthesis
MAVDGQRVAILVPAYNEATQIAGVLASLPDYVDDIVVVDDASSDGTADVVRGVAAADPRVHLIVLAQNRGVGGALAEAFTWARDNGVDCAVTIDGDGQMDPEDIAAIIAPVIDGSADYTKGNRLTDPNSWRRIPRIRLFGNSVLSLLTKIVSGYWSVADSQSGFTATSRYALERIDFHGVYPRYGRPNDMLVHANMADCRVADVPIRAIYGVGERSSMKVLKVTFTISALLFRRFWWRLFGKYVLRDFHPLVFFYLLSTLTTVMSVGLFGRLLYLWSRDGFVPQTTALTLSFFLIATLQSVFFAMWMDSEANADLAVKLHLVRPEARRRVPHPPLGPGGESARRASAALGVGGVASAVRVGPVPDAVPAPGGTQAAPAPAGEHEAGDARVARDVHDAGAEREGEGADLAEDGPEEQQQGRLADAETGRDR